jgi:hypothetical protein
MISLIFESADYWKLTKNGNIAFDGKANLYDENGKLIRETESQGVEGSLLDILGLADNPANREAVVKMMKSNGLTQGTDGKWNTADATVAMRLPRAGGIFERNHVNLNTLNSGKDISLASISQLYDNLDVDKKTYENFVENNYMSAMNFLKYTGNQPNQTWAQNLYQGAYSQTERNQIQTNIAFLQSAQQNGINYGQVVPGVNRSTGFDENVFVALASSDVPGAAFFQEDHTGFDYGAGGSQVNTPGGFWQVSDKNKHQLYLQLYGTDVQMRIQHLDPSNVSQLALNSLIGGDGAAKIINYPTESFGSGTGAHVHIDYTGSIPGSSSYLRTFLNPANLTPGSHLEYQYTYYNAQKNPLAGYPKNFNRY